MQSDSEFVMSMNCFESAMQVEKCSSDLLNQFLNPLPFLNEQSDYCLSDYVCLDNNYGYYSTQQDLNLNSCYLSQEYYSSNTSTIDATSFFAPTDNCQAAYYNSSGSIEYSEEVTRQKRLFSMDEVGMPIEEHLAKKKAKVESKIKKNVKNTKPNKSQNTTNKFCKEGENHNVDVALNIQSTSSCSSEDESNNTSPEIKESSALNLNGKARASKGAATDPQSLYARKRRKRINERLRTLQSLVPNGTKVDISTMLEEAVQYVKFLQLQIKLLSSDDKGMYAPLAYNGMDIGLDLNRDLPWDQH